MAFVVHYDASGNADFSCSGTVVSSNVVMTAGHCAVNETTGVVQGPAGYRVVTGAADWTDATHRQVSAVSQVVVDPAYDPSTDASDAALLVLSTPTTAPAIPLATGADQSLEQPGTGAVIAGWGLTSSSATAVPDVLQWAPTVVQSATYCGQFVSNYPYYPGSQLCAVNYPTDTTATCNGDSGGPLIATTPAGQVAEIGITVRGPTDCDTVSADYFTAVEPLASWADGWISAVAPRAPSPPSSSPAPAPASPAPRSRLPFMTVSTGRSDVQQTLAGAMRGAFTHRHRYTTSCQRNSPSAIRCGVSFSAGPNDYSGQVVVYYVDASGQWADRYAMHWVNAHCHHHTSHPGRCSVQTQRGSW